jgi:replication factor C large subunit
MTTPLFEKYRPKKFDEIKGQDLALSKVRTFARTFSPILTKKKAILLHGPAGTGKTTLAHVLAAEMDYEIFELNASDLRNRKKLEEIMKPSIQQKSLFAKGKIILVDEVDGVTGTDRGGLPELIALIEKTQFPIIITANDVWQQKFSLLRRKTELIALKPLSDQTTLTLITNILQKEDKQLKPQLIQEIIKKARGDLRAAINDLQSLLHLKPGEEHEPDQIGIREKEKDIFHALQEIFKFPISTETPRTFDAVNLELDKIILWLEKNIPKEYKGQELARAMECLSKADVFRGRVYRQQHWRFLVYQSFLLSAGVATASKYKNQNSFTKYDKPTRILKIWMSNQRNAKKKSIAAKYAEYAHISKKRALREFFMISLTLNHYKLLDKLQLSEQEREFLLEYQGALKISHGLNKFALAN